MALVYLNGEIVDEKDAHISVNDRGFVFADGIYEVIRVFDGTPFELERENGASPTAASGTSSTPVSSSSGAARSRHWPATGRH